MNPVAIFCAVWLLLCLFSLPIVAAWMIQAKPGEEIDGIGFVEE